MQVSLYQLNERGLKVMETIQVKVLDLGYMTFYKKELVRTNDEEEMIY